MMSIVRFNPEVTLTMPPFTGVRQESDLTGRRVLVTGAASGIGFACARRLGLAGAAVALVDNRDAVAEAAAQLADLGVTSVALRADVADEGAVTEATETAAATLGGLDGVVTAAGIVRTAATASMALDDWNLVLDVNLTGTFLVVKHTLPHLLAAGGGTVVTIGSVAAVVAASPSAAYEASKAGVLQLTRAVAVEHATDGIRANCVCPGRVRTDLRQNSDELHGAEAPPARRQPADGIAIPMDRRAEAGEIASVVTFLTSDGSSFMTGAMVPVDGGYLAV